MCDMNVPTVCGVTCTDLADDAENCGACGHACAPSALCVRGVCSSGATTIVPPSPGCGDLQLAVENGTIYWTDSARGTVKSQPTAGGSPTTLASNEAFPGLIRVSGSNLFWVTGTTPETIRKMSLPGNSPTDLVTAPPTIHFVVSDDGQSLYYVDGAVGVGANTVGAGVNRVPIAGGPPAMVASGYATQLAIHGSTLAYGNGGELYIVTLADGVVATCGSLPSHIAGTIPVGGVNCLAYLWSHQLISFGRGLVFDGGDLYFSAWPYFPDVWPTGVSTSGLHIVGGQSLKWFIGGPNAIYFVDDQSLIQRVEYAAANGASTVVARGQSPLSMAADATNLYWSTADCAINMMAQ
jgi:hypothetical protein